MTVHVTYMLKYKRLNCCNLFFKLLALVFDFIYKHNFDIVSERISNFIMLLIYRQVVEKRSHNI